MYEIIRRLQKADVLRIFWSPSEKIASFEDPQIPTYRLELTKDEVLQLADEIRELGNSMPR